MKYSRTLWFTGLSGSGKSIIGEKFSDRLRALGLSVQIFDGDVIRKELHRDLKFTKEDIKKNNQLISELCVRYQKQYDYILVPIISPFRESRQKARETIEFNFIEIYVKASLQEVIRRDVKGLYAKALKGEIHNFIGVDPEVPYEVPVCADIVVDTEQEGLESCIKKIENYLLDKFGYL